MWYLSVFVPASEGATATSIAQAVWPNRDGAEANLSIALVDGQGQPWLGGNAAVTDEEIAAMQALGEIPNVRFFRYEMDGERRLRFCSPDTVELDNPWGWEESVAAAGLTIS